MLTTVLLEITCTESEGGGQAQAQYHCFDHYFAVGVVHLAYRTELELIHSNSYRSNLTVLSW